MKKFLILILFFAICLTAQASDIKQLPFKEIVDGNKIKLTDSQSWTDKVKRNDTNIFIKSGNELLSNESSLIVDCDYLFISEGKLFGYSEKDLKFYEFQLTEIGVVKNELTPIETAKLFKDFHIIMISEFSDTTNVYIVKKKCNEEKIMLLNDTDYEFDNYTFTSNNAKFHKYKPSNAIGITKSGMIQFSKYGENSTKNPWFILLVR